MMTWYEKCYGEPPPVKEKKLEANPLPRLLKEERKKEKEAAWYKAKYDYMCHLREQEQQNKEVKIDYE